MTNKTKNVSTREKSVAARREKILEAAMTCFLENGYHQTGVRDIARCAGVSLGNLYNHFPGKHDVLVEIAAIESKEMQPYLKLLSGSGTAPKVLDKFLSAYAKYVAQPDSVALTIEITSEAIRKPDIGDLFLANQEQLVSVLASVIKRGIEDGEFRQKLHPKQTANLIVELIESCAYRSVLSEEPIRKLMPGLKDFVFSALQDS